LVNSLFVIVYSLSGESNQNVESKLLWSPSYRIVSEYLLGRPLSVAQGRHIMTQYTKLHWNRKRILNGQYLTKLSGKLAGLTV